jgi:hypothetical protein
MPLLWHDTLHAADARQDAASVLVERLTEMAWNAPQGGEQLALYEGHQHESYKLDCCLTPSDGHVICGSEDGERHRADIIALMKR